MVKKKKKKLKVVECHQHVDERGIKFGASHPVDAVHKNPKTQKMHELTIERA